VNCSNVGVIRDGTSYSGVDAQDARTESTLSLKHKQGRNFGLKSGGSSEGERGALGY